MNENNEYGQNDVLIARFAKALSHPARISILNLLASRCNCFCGDIVDEIPLAQSTVSQHLKELKEAGLIQGSITPPKIKYCINPENWKTAKKLFNDMFNKSIGEKNECVY